MYNPERGFKEFEIGQIYIERRTLTKKTNEQSSGRRAEQLENEEASSSSFHGAFGKKSGKQPDKFRAIGRLGIDIVTG